ncbi:MAG: M16 family metallopeptidase [Pyrinomonadaceae bacterium]
MKIRNTVTKILLAAGIGLLLLSLAAPALFPQATAKQEKLLNGLKVVMLADQRSPRVELRLRIHSGSAFDPQGKEGVMRLLAANIFPTEVAREYFKEDLGGDLEVVTGYDFIQINASSTPENLLSLIETVANAVTNPAIDRETTARLKSELLAEVERSSKDAAAVADAAAAKRLLGTFPYGRPAAGTAASLQKIDFADLIEARQRFLAADNATLVLAGRFDRTFAFRAVRRSFGSWLKADKLAPSTFRQPDDPEGGVESVDSPSADAFEVRIAMRGTARSSTDLAAVEIAARILESRLRSQVPAEFRESVRVAHRPHTLPGTLIIGFGGTRAATGNKLEASELISRALRAPVADAEFQSAKAAFLEAWNGLPLADRWLDIDTYKLDAIERENARFAATTLADVQAAIDRIQKLPSAAVVVTAQAKGQE